MKGECRVISEFGIRGESKLMYDVGASEQGMRVCEPVADVCSQSEQTVYFKRLRTGSGKVSSMPRT